ncbi:DUF3606 domain-containing protein [Massilia violaceinigra]|uniref:DUF3606 domain-containing protein n=1 Tax=Massilia violaceinigra TaxID=2045208 RepID=A0ABY4A6Z6_9BURK|nr:DUF3606 domain-containing protein [Massilia violaceinigra]UOD30558.1 DUF3606 domain-containing protein [Massilia violaceinigra]
MKTHIENMHDEHEVRYWIDAPGITREQLVAAVREAGPMAAAVRANSGHQADSKTAARLLT